MLPSPDDPLFQESRAAVARRSHVPVQMDVAAVPTKVSIPSYVQVGGALDYWFLAEEDCLPGGPAFDYTYYSTYTRIVGSIAVRRRVTAATRCTQ